MKRSGDSTHPCRSPTPTMSGRDLTLPTRTQTSEQDYSDFMASNRRPSTPYSSNTPQSFSQGTRSYALSRSTKHVKTSSAYSQSIGGEWNVVCCATAGTKTALVIIQLWFNCFAASFFKALGNTNVNYLKIPKKHCGPHKRPSRATCGPRTACLRPLGYRLLTEDTFIHSLNFFQSKYYWNIWN